MENIHKKLKKAIKIPARKGLNKRDLSNFSPEQFIKPKLKNEISEQSLAKKKEIERLTDSFVHNRSKFKNINTLIRVHEGFKEVKTEDLKSFNYLKKLKESDEIQAFIKHMNSNKSTPFNLGTFLKSIQANECTTPASFLKDYMWVDVNEKLGALKEGFHKGVFNYSSNVEFDPKLV